MAAKRRSRSKPEAKAPAGGSDLSAGWVTVAVGLAVTGFLFWKNLFTPMSFDEYYLLNCMVLLGLPLMVVLLGLRREASEFGMTPGDLRGGMLTALIFFALFVPVIYYFSSKPEFQRYYIDQLTSEGTVRFRSGPGALNYGRWAFYEGVLIFYMFAWEWYFRGFLLFGLKRMMPFAVAALLQACAFALLHYHKPLPEVVSSFFGALLLALVANRFRSFLPCFALHAAISVAFDCGVLWHYYR